MKILIQIKRVILFFVLSTTSLFAQSPTISSFQPTSGAIGTVVGVRGTNLINTSNFNIGGASSIIIAKTDSSILAMVMSGAITGSLDITTPGGSVSSLTNFTISATSYPTTQELTKLIGTGANGAAKQGISSAISADGNTVVIGGHEDNGGIGAVWVFVRVAGKWSQQGSKLVGTDAIGNANQGYRVAISADGNTILSTGYTDNGGVGAAWVFTRTNGTWTQHGSKLVANDMVGNAKQGSSCGISADGNTIVVGGPEDDGLKGAAWVFIRNGVNWSQQGNKLVGTAANGNASQATGLAISADGNTITIGGPKDDANIGATWVFTRAAGVWSQQGTKLVGTGYVGNAEQGISTSLNANGSTLAIGASMDNVNVGAVWIFTWDGFSWNQQGNKLVGANYVGSPNQGVISSLSADGNTLVVSGYNDDAGIGAAWIFTRSAGVWNQQGNKLVGSGAVGAASQGSSVSITPDASSFILSGNLDDNSTGATWVFNHPSNDANLSNLSINAASISPAFDPNVTTYSATVNFSTTSLDLSFVNANNQSTISLNGNQQLTNSVNMPLSVGANTFTYVVTAGDGSTTKTYTLNVTRSAIISSVTLLTNNAISSLAATNDTIKLNITASSAIQTPTVVIAGIVATVTNTSGNNWLATVKVNSSTTRGVVSFSVAYSDLLGNNGTTITSTTNSSSVNILNTLDLAGLSKNSLASAVYSLRRMSSEYSGNALQVLRSNDFQTLDIGFDVNGHLDTTALKTFVGNNNGFVNVWYDQSGNGFHTVTVNASGQPQIITNGNLYKLNKKPHLFFRGLVLTGAYRLGGNVGQLGLHDRDFELNSVLTPSTRDLGAVLGENNELYLLLFSTGGGNTNRVSLRANSAASNRNNPALIYDGTQITIAGARVDSGNVRARKDGIDAGTTETMSQQTASSISLFFGCTNTSSVSSYIGNMGEFLIFPHPIPTERTNLEANQQAYYLPPILNNVHLQSNNTNNFLAKVGNTITLSFTSNNTISNPTVTILGKSASVSNPSGNNWNATLLLDNSVPEGPVTFEIYNYTDLLLNAGDTVRSTTDLSSVRIDTTAPVLNSVSIASNNSLSTSRAKVGDIIKLSFQSNGAIINPTVSIVGKNATVNNVSGNNWEATLTLDGTATEGLVTFTINYSDSAGNAGIVATSTTNSSAVTIDRTIPTISNIKIKSNNADTTLANNTNIITITFTSNESLSNSPNVTIAGMTASVNNITGNTWQAQIMVDTTATHGLVSFSIIGKDLAGNNSATITSTTDLSAVTIPPFNYVHIQSNNSNSSLAKNGDVITLAFTSNKSIQTPTVTIAGSNASINKISNTSWQATLTVTNANATGVVNFSVNFNYLIDATAGTAVSTTTDLSTVTIDNQAPSLTSVSIASNNTNPNVAKQGDIISLSFTSIEPIKTPTIVIAGKNATISNPAGNNWVGTVTVTRIYPTDTVNYSIVYSDLLDNAGDTIRQTTDNSFVLINLVYNNFSRIGFTTNQNASAAYSLRKLSNDYNGNAIQVRRSSDNSTLDIGFDVNGVLDTITLKTFVGSSDGTVNIWYDQSGNACNATSESISLEPFIIQAGVLVTLYKVPNLRFTSGMRSFKLRDKWATLGINDNEFEMNVVFSGASGVTKTIIGNNEELGLYRLRHASPNSVLYYAGLSPSFSTASTAPNIINSTYAIAGARYYQGAFIARKDGVDGNSLIASNTSSDFVVYIGRDQAITTYLGGRVAEVFIFPETINTERAGLELNQKAYYFPPVLSNVNIQSNFINTAKANKDNTITVSFTANEPIQTPTITIAGKTASVSNPSANNWQGVITVDNTTPLGVASINITYSDLIGNSGVAVTNTTNASTVTVDTTLSIATLSGYTINTGTLTPAFDPAITSYSATVSNATSVIRITPLSTASTAIIKVNGTALTSGAESGDIPLSFGLNTITIFVKAADSTSTKTYTLTVNRLSSNADLSNLSISNGALSPVFNSDSLNYTTTLCNNVLSVTLTPTSADATATIKVNGVSVASGAASNSIPLSIGLNNINIEVTAGDGVTIKNYTLAVTVNTCNNLYWNTNGVSAGIKTANWSINGAAPYTTAWSSQSNIIFTATSIIQFVHFTGVGNLTITNASAVNWQASGTYLTLDNGINGTIRTFDIGLGSSLNWNGQAISSSAGTGFIKNGEGSWLMGAQTGAFSAGFTLNAGAVILGSTGNTIGVGPLIINGGVVAGNGTSVKVPSVSSITVNANFMLGNTPTLSNANASITFNSGVSLGSGVTRTITVGGNIATGSTGVYTFNGVISGSNSGIIFDRLPASNGRIVLSGANTYNGGTTIRRGNVSFGASNVLANSGFIHLNGGTLSTGVTTGFTDTVGVLNLTANSTIELGTGSHTLSFTASNGQSWNTDTILTIIGWTGGYNRLATATGGRIFVGTNATGLTATQINQIRFTHPTTGLTHTAKLLTTGELVPMGPAVTSLSNLTTSSGSLSPSFHSDSTSYNVRVGNLISSITVTPTTINDLATINVNGTLVLNANASGNIPLTIGANTITIVVTAEDNTTKTYSLTVTRESTDATLSNLTLSTGTINPVFASGTTTYTTSVDFTVSSITLTPTATNYQATIKVNGTTVSSGAASGSIALSVGTNTITTVVTAGDGTTTNTYTLTVTRNFDATLSNLSLSSGTLTPAFASGTFSYTASVSASTNGITLTPTASVGSATITVNGSSVASGVASDTIFLTTGPNTITTVVTALDGTIKTYSLIVTRQSSDATLSNLTISNGTLSPSFTSNTTFYNSSTISAGTNSITITPTATNNQATIVVDGTPVASGQASASIVLSGGLTLHYIDVTAGDGTTLRYTVRVAYAGKLIYWNTDGVTRNMTSSNWSSTGLPPFNEAFVNCNSIVFSSNSDIVNDSYSVLGIKITDSSTVNWQRSGSNFRMSCNEINGMISTFDISAGSSLLWNGQAIYAATGTGFVKNGGGSWYMGNMTGNYTGGFTLNDGAIVFGTAGLGSGPLVINGGQIASGGTTNKSPSVSSVTIGGDFMLGNSAALNNANGSLTFNSGVSLGSSVTRTITVGGDITTGSTGVYTFNGIISGSNSGIIFDRLPASTGRIVLAGANTYNGGTTIRRGKVSLGTSNVLANAGFINLNGGTLNTGVTTGFSDEVGVLNLSANSTIELGTGSHTLTFAASNGQSWTGATILTITGWTGGYNNLASATGGRIFVGTDASGLTSTQIAQIRFNHPTTGIIHTAKLLSTGELVPIGPTIATLSNLTISSGTLSPVFESDSINYTVSVSNATTSVTLTPTTTNNQAIVKINGVSVLSGNASGNIPLTVGVNTINILVTAGDSVTTKTYTVRVTRAPSSNADLSNLTISSGTLSPVFATDSTSYTASVTNATNSVTITPTTAVSTSTLTVNGTTLASGATSGSISLSVGVNTITTVVTAEDGVTTKTYTINLTRIAPPTISTSGTLTALSTTYGTASSSISFNVSGSNMLGGILVSPPTGFEVSTDNSTFSNTVTLGSAGTISSTPVYIRLHASNAVGNYSGNIVLSSSSATNVNVATVLSTVNAKVITVTADAKTKVYGDADPSFTYTYTPALIGADAFTGALARTAGESFGKHAITQGTLALSANYTITYDDDSLSITKKTIAVTADTKTKTYGDADPTFTYTYTPALIGADAFTGSLTRTAGENIGKYSITQGTLSLGANYAITYDDDSLSITKKTIAVTADTKTKVYGDVNPSFTYTYTPALIGADAFTGSLTRTTGENIGKYAITQGTLTLGANYTITYDDDSLSITKKTITVSADAKTKVYGDVDPSFTYTFTPALIGADAFTGSLTRATGENIGTYAINQGSLALSANYTITYDDDSLSITKKTITVSADAKTKVYGDADPAFTYTFTPALIGTDAFTGNLTRATGENIGKYAITQGTLALSSNYTITYNRDSLSITKKTITVTADAKTKVYGDADPSFTYTFTPALIGTDAFTGALARTAGENIGKYAINQGTLALSGNYTITYDDDSLSITKKTIAVTADAKTKIYGDADPSFTYTYTPALIGADAFTGALARTAGENIGKYAINQGTLALSSNYTITYNRDSLSITKKTITVTADSKTKVYGDVDPTFTYTFTPALIGADAFTGSLSRATGENIGKYVINQGTLALSSNYTITYNRDSLSITKKTITVTADTKTKVYGDADPTFTYTFTPALIGADSFTGALARIAGENIGKYAINQGTLTLSSNYTITYNRDSLSITKKTITVTADAKTKVYGDADPSFTYTFTPALIGADAFAGSLTRATGENIGKYVINQGTLALPSNYTITYTRDSLSITKKTITVTADTKSKVYGDADPSFTYTFTPALIGADAFTGALARAAGENIGKYAITQGTLALNSNYTITYNRDSLSITKKTITVTADTKTKVYGDADPTFTYTFTPALIGADAFSGSLSRAAGENIGKYAITQGTLALSSNYTITYNRDSLSITKKTINVTADAKTKVYGDADPAFTYSFTPALIGADAFTGSLTRAIGENIGKYVINQGTLALSSNYTITYNRDSLSITKKTITVTADAKTKVYGDADPSFTYTFTPALIGADAFTGALVRAIGENIGKYVINQGTLALSSNYTITYNRDSISITKKTITVSADAKTKVYGDADPAFTYTFTPALIGADAFTGALARTGGENIGKYAINQGTLALSSNYTITYNRDSLSITKKTITVTADAKTKVYGDTDPLFTYTYTPALIGADAFSGSLTRAAGENIGTYAISQGSLVLNSNYSITFVGSNFTIGTRQVTVKANAQGKNYGDIDPTLTYLITSGSLVGGDAFSGSLVRIPGESVGKYSINQGSLALNTNYSLTFLNDSLTIGTNVIVVKAVAKSKIYGSTDPILTYTIVSGSLSFGDSFTGSLARTVGEDVGIYSINKGTLSLNPSYTLIYQAENLSITTKAIAVTADSKTKVYGDVDPSLTYTYTPALIGADLFTGALARTTGETIGKYAITQGTLSLGANYTITYDDDSLSITKKTITVTADTKTKVYGDADPIFTYTFTPALIGADAFTGSLSRTTGENIGKYAISQGTLSLGANYSITYDDDSLNITKKTITVTADAKTKVYGDADPSFTYTYTPALIGADAFTGSLSRTTGENIGKYSINQGTLALSSNYTITYNRDSLSITAKTITVTADAKTKVYGDADPSFTYTFTPALIGADAFTGSLTRTAGENIGKYAITQGTLALSSNYTITYNRDSLSITKKTITVTADAKTKVYGDADPSFTYTFTPALIGADAFTGSLTRATGENIGKYAISQGTLSLGANYSITYDDDSLSITKKTIAVTADTKTKTYGDADPTFTYTYTPALIGADAFTGSLSRTTGENIGKYSINQGTLALSSNYTITYNRDSLSITAKTITVTADAKTKVYGDADPSFTYTFTPALIGADAFTGALARTAGESIGKYAISQGTLSLGANYAITYDDDSLSITKKTVTVTADAKTKVYGDVDPTFTYTFSPALIGADAFTGALTRIAGENIGKYAITQGTLALSSNYTITYNRDSLSITKKTITVTADAKTKVYGDSDPSFTYTFTPALIGTDAFTGALARTAGENIGKYAINQGTLALSANYTITYNRDSLSITTKAITVTADAKTKVYGDADPSFTYTFTPALIGTDAFTGALARTAGENIGMYAINQGTLALSSNYTITYNRDSLSITKKAITVTAQAKTKVYGDADPSFTYTYTPALIGADAFTGSLTRATGENIGKYVINQGTLALSANYIITYDDDSLSITTKTITVTADSKTKVYGDADPAFTYTFTPALIGADAFTGALARTAGENIGKYVINQGTLALSSNYTITYNRDSLSITKKTITVTADSKTKVYGDVDPAFTYTFTPALIGADAFTGALARTAGENIGKYVINQGTLALSSNYTITYNRDSLSITKKTITVTADTKTKVYGAADPTFTYTFTPALIGADAFTGSLSRATGESIGKYAINQGTLTLGVNYTITYDDDSLRISKKTIAVTADAKTKVYGDADPAFTYTFTPALIGADAFTGSLSRATGENIGKYLINQGTLALSSNYTITYNRDSLSITKKVITVTADAKTKVYGDADPSFTYTFTPALIGADAFAGSLTRATGENIGKYVITQGTLALNSNYTITYNRDSLSITKKVITITADAKTKVYGDADPAFTYTFTPALIGTDAFTGSLSRTAGENIGKYVINQGTLSLGANYTITYDDDSLSITSKAITVTAQAKTKVYGDADPSFTYTFTPALIGTDAFTGALARTAGENIGKYVINQGTLALNSNYTITYNCDSLSITKKTITVTAQAKTKVYGGIDPSFTYTFTPDLIGTDAFTGALARTAGENIGKYAINQGTLSLGANYTITYDDDSLSITKKTITVTAQAKTKVYGDADPAFTYSFTPALIGTDAFTGALARTAGENIGKYAINQGTLALPSNYTITYNRDSLSITKRTITVTADAKTKVYGDVDPSFTYTYTPALIGADAFTGSLTRASGESIGKYAINQGTLALPSNYTITYNRDSLSITAKIITVTADAKTKMYGEADPLFTYTYTPTLIGADAFTGSLTRASGENIGKYVINQGTLSLGANYTITYDDDSLSITTKTIMVTADAKSKMYGDADPSFTYTYTPALIGGDAFSGTLARTAGEDIGKYPINQGSLSLGTNYTIVYIVDSINIGSRGITVRAQFSTKLYGDADPVFSYTYTPALIGTDDFTGALARTPGESIGKYEINQGSLSLGSNYVITFNEDTLSITPKTITVTADAKVKMLGELDPEWTYTVSSALVGTDVFTGKLARELGEEVGVYPIHQGTLALNSNYELIFIESTCTILGPESVYLNDIALSAGKLSPIFDSSNFVYNANVSDGINSLSVTPFTKNDNAIITINGEAVFNGTPSRSFDITEGLDTLRITVSLENQNIFNTYKIAIKREVMVVNPTNILSPNGDGVNDLWVIDNITEYPDNRVSLFDRYGKVIYSKLGYSNEWDGTVSGIPLEEDTYYYVIELGTKSPAVKGYITLIRER